MEFEFNKEQFNFDGKYHFVNIEVGKNLRFKLYELKNNEYRLIATNTNYSNGILRISGSRCFDGKVVFIS